MRYSTSNLLLVLAVTCLTGCASLPPSPATPQRPSYSSDASTTAHQTVEIEMGLAADETDAIDSPVNVKWGATRATELFLGFSPYASIKPGPERESGFGDVIAGARVRFLDEREGRPAAAVQMTAKLPAADDGAGLGTGETDVFGAGILTKTFDRTTVVWFYQLGVLGNPAQADVDLEHGGAVAFARPIAQNLGGFVEFAGVFTPDQDITNVFTTIGIGYGLRANIILDAAIAVGLSDDAVDWVGNVGLTANLGSLVP